MSTRSCIIVKVRPSDMGQVIKFKESALPVKQERWGEGRKLNKEKPVELTGNYIGIYCHSDGYPSGVGNVLKKKFNNYEQVLNLVAGGHCSFVWFDGVRRYATRKGEEWEYLTPKQGNTPKEVYEKIDCQYAYLFEEGEWLVNDFEEGGFKPYTGEKE